MLASDAEYCSGMLIATRKSGRGSRETDGRLHRMLGTGELDLKHLPTVKLLGQPHLAGDAEHGPHTLVESDVH